MGVRKTQAFEGRNYTLGEEERLVVKAASTDLGVGLNTNTVAPGAGLSSSVFTPDSHVREYDNGDIVTTIKLDLTGLKSVATLGDVIGIDGGGSAALTQVTDARNGKIHGVQMICVETPVGGALEIDLFRATGSGLAYSAPLTSGNEAAIFGPVWAENGRLEPGSGKNSQYLGSPRTDFAISESYVQPVNFISSSDYLYLASGVATAGTYTAGKFIIKLRGYKVFS